jgi:hypothetical protein
MGPWGQESVGGLGTLFIFITAHAPGPCAVLDCPGATTAAGTWPILRFCFTEEIP